MSLAVIGRPLLSTVHTAISRVAVLAGFIVGFLIGATAQTPRLKSKPATTGQAKQVPSRERPKDDDCPYCGAKL